MVSTRLRENFHRILLKKLGGGVDFSINCRMIFIVSLIRLNNFSLLERARR
jgi:hypothetical protein